MPKRKSISEISPGYKTAQADIRNPVILQREGQPLAVIISYDDYQRLCTLIADEEQRHQAGWATLKALVEQVHQHATQYTPGQIEAEIGTAREEVKKSLRAYRRSH
jgi:PHD/YefM family antitoxin component YafN of YafNO toxin-antitoxin module